ncbi:MAG: N-acetylmuramoyl-L-alanine amidase [bacterium]|nr:N-acetylmuramoyl-L-alanine amidase [bacterium]
MRRLGRRARGGWLLAIGVLVPALVAIERPPGLSDVADVRTWSYPEYTRVVLELEGARDLGPPALVRLPPNSAAHRPERLYLDVPDVWVGRRFEEGVEVGDGLLEGVRLGQNTLSTTRLVLDLARYDHHRVFTLPAPPRIVVDVYGERGQGADPAGRLPAGLRRVQTVVVDPGHGGSDPGALGVGGLREKDVNLGIARALATELRARGFDVVLTRDDDRALSLEDRSAIAESAGGDVFVSIHANAARRKGARGIEVYTLDANHERHSLDVAARENNVPAARLDALQRALARIRVDDVGDHSARLATHVHDQVIQGARSRDASLPDLGVKKGPFYVLFMSSMSAVLVETGFVTNRRDARLLGSERYQALLAERIAMGIDRYRTEIETGLAARGLP